MFPSNSFYRFCENYRISEEFECLLNGEEFCVNCQFNFLYIFLHEDVKQVLWFMQKGLRLDRELIAKDYISYPWFLSQKSKHVLEKLVGVSISNAHKKKIKSPPSLIDIARLVVRDNCSKLPLHYNCEVPNDVTDLINFKYL